MEKLLVTSIFFPQYFQNPLSLESLKQVKGHVNHQVCPMTCMTFDLTSDEGEIVKSPVDN